MNRPPKLWMALCLALGPAVSNGLGRFAYALILPAMREDLAWSYTQAGWVNTANALGYLVGAILFLWLVRRVGARLLFDGGMVLTAITLLASGLVRDDFIFLVLRLLTGIGGACAFIGGGALVTALFAEQPEKAPATIAIYYAGGGAGIFLSGVGLPWLFALRGAGAWTEAWIGLGILSIVLTVPTLIASAQVPPAPVQTARQSWNRKPLLASLSGYFLFAIGAIIYMTFIVAWMRSSGASAGEISLMWGTLGVAILASPLAWKPALARWPGGWPLAASTFACAVGGVLPLFSASLPVMLLSAIIFGGSFFIPPAAVTAISRKALPRSLWGAGIATYTISFGIGQPIGPALAGAVADWTGTLFAGLATAVVTLVAGAILAALQRPVSDPV